MHRAISSENLQLGSPALHTNLYSPLPPYSPHLFYVLSTKMAEKKTEYLENGGEISADDVELNATLAVPSTQESAISQTLDVCLAEMISC